MKVTPFIASTFKSDGGTMFGLVPKPIWEKRIQPDEKNRIPQNAHSLLVELDDGRKGLVDTGCGSPKDFTDKEIELHGLGAGWPLCESLKKMSIDPKEIEFVIFSHVHWDHAGGASHGNQLTFPNATHFTHELEWKDATSGNTLLYKSYPSNVIEPLKQARLKLATDDQLEIFPGLKLVRSSGHTRGHSVIVFEGENIQISGNPHLSSSPSKGEDRGEGHSNQNIKTSFLVFAGDVCPTRHHLRMVFQTSYDTFPLDTRAWKQAWLPKLAQKNGWLMFDHDPDVFGITLKADPRDEFAPIQSLPAKPLFF